MSEQTESEAPSNSQQEDRGSTDIRRRESSSLAQDDDGGDRNNSGTCRHPSTGVVVTARDLGLNEQEDVERAMEWLLHGKMDAKHLAKTLPHTAQDLRDGKVTKETLKDRMSWVIMETLTLTTNDGFEGTPMELISKELSLKAIPEWWCRNDEQRLWIQKAHEDFARDLYRQFRGDVSDLMMRDFDLYIDKHTATLQSIEEDLRETCKEWAQRIDDALFNGQRSGTFLFLCPTDALTIPALANLIHEIYEKAHNIGNWFENLDKCCQLGNALLLVEKGAHETLELCWECRRTLENVLDRCSACNVARYCCRDCQVKAWKDGHNQQCKTLKEKYNALVESLDAVDLVHTIDGGTLEGFPFCCRKEYSIVKTIFQVPHPYPCSDSTNARPQGPSMKYFYENFGRILRNGWWFYSQSDTEAYEEKLSNARIQSYHPFYCLLYCLCYDIFGFVAEKEESDNSDREDQMRSLFENSLVTDLRHEVGAAMPRETFLQTYQQYHSIDIKDMGLRRSQKRDAKAATLLYFQKHLHK